MERNSLMSESAEAEIDAAVSTHAGRQSEGKRWRDGEKQSSGHTI